uniref:Uncharacterized protein n=1 Tax=Panagrolaimus davidi TaxID=227884 RepID=A0A914QFP7_9BILA
MDATMRYCLVAVASLSFGILIVSCIRILWNKLNEGRAEENAINNRINQIRPPSPPITIYTITTLPNLNDFPANISPTGISDPLPSYRNALLNAAVLHFMDEKTKENKPPDYDTTSITPQDTIGAPPSYHP